MIERMCQEDSQWAESPEGTSEEEGMLHEGSVAIPTYCTVDSQ